MAQPSGRDTVALVLAAVSLGVSVATFAWRIVYDIVTGLKVGSSTFNRSAPLLAFPGTVLGQLTLPAQDFA